MRENRDYVTIPGNKTHELPPLLVHSTTLAVEEPEILDMASALVEAEEMLPPVDADEDVVERRKHDLAATLADQYRAFISHWQWGDSILEWIRQCEITFEAESTLRNLLHPDVWPHANRSSFVNLLADKAVPSFGLAPFKLVGLRLTFRQPPPIACFSDQFLFYLHSSVADSAYQAWAHLATERPALLPPHRFHFDIVDLD